MKKRVIERIKKKKQKKEKKKKKKKKKRTAQKTKKKKKKKEQSDAKSRGRKRGLGHCPKDLSGTGPEPGPRSLGEELRAKAQACRK